jgi:uncharacterized protein
MQVSKARLDQRWGRYHLVDIGFGAALFDPIQLRTIYLSEAEVSGLLSGDPAAVAEVSRFGFLETEEHVDYRQAVAGRLASLGITGNPTSIAGYRIVVTDRCNMACSYCFVDTNTGAADLTEPDLRRGLDLLFEVNAGTKEITYQWFGGEPTIRTDLMMAGDHYARELADRHDVARVQPTVVTNGAHLSQQMIEHFLEFRYGVGVSIDGPPSTNGLERVLLSGKPADARIHKNIRRLLAAGVHVGANVTPTLHNLRTMVEAIDYIIDLGVKFIYVNTPIPAFGDWPVHGAELAEALFAARLHALARGAMVFSHLDRIYQALDSRQPRVYEHLQPGGGVNVALLPGGRISVLDLNWRDERFIFTLDEIATDRSRLGTAAKTLHPIDDCATCPAAAICGGPTLNERLLRRDTAPSADFCAFFRRATTLAISDTTGLQ